jgi:sugar phosphate isomerase/epimerase
VEPGRRRRPARLREHLRRHAGLDLTDRFSLPTFNWLRFREDGAPEPLRSLDEVLDGAAAAGFTRVGLDVFSVDGRVDVAAALAERGLECSDVGVLALGSPGARESAERLARLAAAVGAPFCIAAVPHPLPREAAIRHLHAAATTLAEAGARIALEFTAYGGLTRLADAVALCEAVGWERCGVLVDTWHFFRTGEPWPLLRSLDADRVAVVHVNDGPRGGGADPLAEGRFGRLPPGYGEFPLDAFAAALESIGYRGAIAVEVLSDDVRLLPPRLGARLLMTSLRECWPAATRPALPTPAPARS